MQQLNRVLDGEQPKRINSAPNNLSLLATGITTEVYEGGTHEDRLLRPPSPATFGGEVSEGLLARVSALEVTQREDESANTPPSPLRPPSTASRSASVSGSGGNLEALGELELPPALSSRPAGKESSNMADCLSLSPSLPPRPSRPGLRK
mmetsp:Transcript_49880/g.138266  ORF Transcript_49880/g.138266 Transcript_49880/m.138266 type:complete len:150 (+) Transcript_49880:3-452(+)